MWRLPRAYLVIYLSWLLAAAGFSLFIDLDRVDYHE